MDVTEIQEGLEVVRDEVIKGYVFSYIRRRSYLINTEELLQRKTPANFLRWTQPATHKSPGNI